MELDTTRAPWWERSETRARRWGGLLVALGVISVLHYATSPDRAELHVLYQRLYYGPIVVGAYWFGVRGGVATAIAAALAYAPHIHHAWANNAPYTFSQYSELVIFVCAGGLVGFLADVQRRLTRQYQVVARSLETRNRELKDSHDQLRRADRLAALGQIAAGLAHEIRNPLAGIKGALDIIVSKVDQGTPESEFAGIAATELERLNDLVQEFLTYARPHAPELRSARLRDVVEHVLLLLRPEAERAGVILVHQAGEALPDTHIDAEQVRQVLFNLVLNGIQATPPSGEIRIETFSAGSHAIVQVTDQGPGFPPDHLARVFDPFFTTKPHGTGLGLAISQRIIEAHHGEIDVRNTAGGGAVVRIALPFQPVASSGSPSQGARP
jgi:signal transduction histidine kinase